MKKELKTVQGIEVEGRLSGIPTLFVHNEIINPDTYPHLYFNPDYIEQNNYESIIQYLNEGKLVTVCVTPEMLKDVPDLVLRQAHIVVAISCNDKLEKYLKPNDEIRLDYSYQKCSLTQFNCFTHNHPEDYKNDTTF